MRIDISRLLKGVGTQKKLSRYFFIKDRKNRIPFEVPTLYKAITKKKELRNIK